MRIKWKTLAIIGFLLAGLICLMVDYHFVFYLRDRPQPVLVDFPDFSGRVFFGKEINNRPEFSHTVEFDDINNPRAILIINYDESGISLFKCSPDKITPGFFESATKIIRIEFKQYFCCGKVSREGRSLEVSPVIDWVSIGPLLFLMTVFACLFIFIGAVIKFPNFPRRS